MCEYRVQKDDTPVCSVLSVDKRLFLSGFTENQGDTSSLNTPAWAKIARKKVERAKLSILC